MPYEMGLAQARQFFRNKLRAATGGNERAVLGRVLELLEALDDTTPSIEVEAAGGVIKDVLFVESAGGSPVSLRLVQESSNGGTRTMPTPQTTPEPEPAVSTADAERVALWLDKLGDITTARAVRRQVRKLPTHKPEGMSEASRRLYEAAQADDERAVVTRLDTAIRELKTRV